MAVGRLGALCDRLMSEAGYPATCPVAVVEKASQPEQRIVKGEVKTIADIAKALKISPPATVIVGSVVDALHGKQTGLVRPWSASRH